MKTNNKTEQFRSIFLILSALVIITPTVQALLNYWRFDSYYWYRSFFDYYLSYLTNNLAWPYLAFETARITSSAAFIFLLFNAASKQLNPKSATFTIAFVLIFVSYLGWAIYELYNVITFGEYMPGFDLLIELLLSILCAATAVLALLCAVKRGRRFGKTGFATIAAGVIALLAVSLFLYSIIRDIASVVNYGRINESYAVAMICDFVLFLLRLLPAAALLLLSLNNGFTSEEAYAAAKASASGGISGAEERLMQLAARYREGKITAEEYNRERANIYREL